MQGPTLFAATSAASRLGVVFPTDVALAILRDPNPGVRAQACACVRSGYEVVAALIALLADRDPEVSVAAACALGRMGRTEARIPLKRHLTERASARVVEAVAGVADDESVVWLARVARRRLDLTESVLAALEVIDTPRAASAASALRSHMAEAGAGSDPGTESGTS